MQPEDGTPRPYSILMMIADVADFKLMVDEPKLLEHGDSDKPGTPSLRFNLFLCKGEAILARIDGFRVCLGEVKPPMRRTPKGWWYPIIKPVTGQWERMLAKLVNHWREEFPTVEFPEVKE